MLRRSATADFAPFSTDGTIRQWVPPTKRPVSRPLMICTIILRRSFLEDLFNFTIARRPLLNHSSDRLSRSSRQQAAGSRQQEVGSRRAYRILPAACCLLPAISI